MYVGSDPLYFCPVSSSQIMKWDSSLFRRGVAQTLGVQCSKCYDPIPLPETHTPLAAPNSLICQLAIDRSLSLTRTFFLFSLFLPWQRLILPQVELSTL